MNLTRIPWTYTGRVKINFLDQVFRKLSYYRLRMRAFSFMWPLPVTWQRWRSHHSIRHSQNPMLHANLIAQYFTEPELWVIEVLHCGNKYFRLFSSCDLDLGPMTFTWPILLDDASVQIWTSYVKLSKVIVWQTDRNEIMYHTASLVVKNTDRNSLELP